jgi:hypothetical protein
MGDGPHLKEAATGWSLHGLAMGSAGRRLFVADALTTQHRP